QRRFPRGRALEKNAVILSGAKNLRFPSAPYAWKKPKLEILRSAQNDSVFERLRPPTLPSSPTSPRRQNSGTHSRRVRGRREIFRASTPAARRGHRAATRTRFFARR